MALITRISKLFQADVHAVLDCIEEPVIVLKQAVREMEEALQRDERQLKLTIHEASQLEKRNQDITESLARIEGELEVCFSHGRDELARTLIRRKLEAEQFRGVLTRQQQTLQQSTATLQARISECASQLESMRQKAELLANVPGKNSFEANEWSLNPEHRVRDEDIEVAYLREKALHENTVPDSGQDSHQNSHQKKGAKKS